MKSSLVVFVRFEGHYKTIILFSKYSKRYIIAMQGRPKMMLRKTFEGDFKKIGLTWGMAERKQKI